MPTVKDEASDDILEFTKSLFEEGKVAVSDNTLYCDHRITPSYGGRITNKNVKVPLWDLPHSDKELCSVAQRKI